MLLASCVRVEDKGHEWGRALKRHWGREEVEMLAPKPNRSCTRTYVRKPVTCPTPCCHVTTPTPPLHSRPFCHACAVPQRGPVHP